MIDAVHRLLLGIYARLPRRARRHAVRILAPSFTVGALGVVRHDDGRVALISHRYRSRWGLPGGLLSRGEVPAEAVVREIREEVGLVVEIVGEPVVVVEPVVRRVDIVFETRMTEGSDPDALTPTSAEIVAAAWFTTGDLPELQEETVAAFEALDRRNASVGRPDEPSQ
ncbi:MAG: NUDIX hydrolase [Acidimicrobiales bacterium]